MKRAIVFIILLIPASTGSAQTKGAINGRVVAEFLRKHKKVKKVLYPGFADHPQHALAKRQMKGFGSMITFETGSLNNAKKMLRKVRVCSLGE